MLEGQICNNYQGVSGGEKGIRTLETVPRLHTFQACAFDHSATSPHRLSSGLEGPDPRSPEGRCERGAIYP